MIFILSSPKINATTPNKVNAAPSRGR